MKDKLMVVDDENDILVTIKTIFEHHGYEVTAVSNGVECVKNIEAGFKGVILLDVMMPGMDGWDTLKTIIEKELWKGIIIIMLTAVEHPDPKMENVKEADNIYLST